MYEKTKLKKYFTTKEPFGPTNAEEIEDSDDFNQIFFKENLIYNAILKHPTLIIGRRGSGKTAFLNSVMLDSKYEIIIVLKPQNTFREIIKQIEQMSSGTIFAEEVSDFWNILFWSTILSQLVRKYGHLDEIKKIREYLLGIGIKIDKNPYTIMRGMIDGFKARTSEKLIGLVSDLIDEIAFNDIVFSEVRDIALDFMQDKNIRAIILLDSLERFQLEAESMGNAISGLLKCQGEFRKPGSQAELRCCLPAEIYHELLELSINPNKDFKHKVILHWHAGELLRLATKRYSIYLDLYEQSFYKKINNLDLNKRNDALTFWNSFFPRDMKNTLGSVENSVSYILRHTQLLPRQLLLYLNNIVDKNFEMGGTADRILPESIVHGVIETEEIICNEIFSAFEYIHPGARQACEQCISYLPFRFEYGFLHHVYNERGKGISNVYDFGDFIKLMKEIGAIGKVIRETERYVEGIFEYAVPHRLVLNSDDELCLHPVFCRIFRAKKPKSGPECRVIYPFGTDIELEEYRKHLLID